MPFSFANPEELVVLQQTLERAWALVVAHHGEDPLRAAGERERLAYIVARLWQQDVHNSLAERAAEEFEASSPDFGTLLRPGSELKGNEA